MVNDTKMKLLKKKKWRRGKYSRMKKRTKNDKKKEMKETKVTQVLANTKTKGGVWWLYSGEHFEEE